MSLDIVSFLLCSFRPEATPWPGNPMCIRKPRRVSSEFFSAATKPDLAPVMIVIPRAKCALPFAMDGIEYDAFVAKHSHATASPNFSLNENGSRPLVQNVPIH